ncbi:restriction endonuclease subunit S [Campylobacter upsaliensis]
MKTDTLKKSLLDYAIKGKLTARFRRENNGLNAFNELEIYNDNIKQKRKNLEKELNKCEKEFKLEKDKDKKALFKSQIQILKKELTKRKEIQPIITPASLRGEAEANHTPKTANRLPQVSSETLAMTTIPPFEIPNSWAWVKLGDICEIFTGDSINATEKEKNFTHQTSGLNYIATKDLANDTSITYENGIKIPDEFLPSFKIAKANSTLLCIEGGSAGRKVGFLKENVCFGNKLCCFENIFAFSKFVFYFLQSGEFSKEFNSNINGIIGGVKKESIRHFLIPLPPLCEQQEIVKKLDLLVSLANDFAITKENLKRI